MKQNIVKIFAIGGLVLCVVTLFVGIDRRDAKIAAQQAVIEAADARQVAVATAVEQFRIVRSLASTGDAAIAAESEITRTLREVGLNFGAIGASEAEVSRFVAEAYARDAHKALNELRMLKANPEWAATLRAEFLRCVDRSEKSLASFVANVNVVNELVARNYIGAARAQGARVSTSSLRQQGVAVGSARKVQATRKPVAKKAAPKSAKRSTSARRR